METLAKWKMQKRKRKRDKKKKKTLLSGSPRQQCTPMRVSFELLVWVAVLLACVDSASAKYISSIYYASWSHSVDHLPSDIDLSLITHINYAFFNIDMATMDLKLSDPAMEATHVWPFHTFNQNSSYPNETIWNDIKANNVTSMGLIGQLNQMRSINPRLSISLSIGGEDSFRSFETVANNKRGVDFFVNNTINQMVYYGFDGIDIDWEFPDRDVYKPYLTYMMHTFRHQLDLLQAQEMKRHQQGQQQEDADVDKACHYTLSLALPMDLQTLQNYQLSQLGNIVDHFHLMGYSNSGPNSTQSNFHSPLYQGSNPENEALDNINQTVYHLLDSGVASDQIILGLPAYGISFPVENIFETIPEDEHGKCATIKGISQGSECAIQYNSLPPAGFKEVFDQDVGSSYCTSTTGHNGIVVYDTTEAVNAKAEFIKEMNLGGAFWWNSEGDTWSSNWSRSLVKAYVDNIGQENLHDQDNCKIIEEPFFDSLVTYIGPSKNSANTVVISWTKMVLGGLLIFSLT